MNAPFTHPTGLPVRAGLRHSLFAQNELKLTIRMGVMISTAVGIMLTAMKFMH